MRLQKILAQAGYGSRRKCEDLIKEGRVKVNGKTATLGDGAEANDKVTVDDKRVILEKKVYLALNKPKGFIVTVTDEKGRRTIMDLIKVPQRIFPIGRLDKETEGLILLTNDGDFAQKILHPSNEITKEYQVVLDKAISHRERSRLQKGIPLEGRKVKMIIRGKTKKLNVIIHEGRKHILRRIFRRLGYEVVSLRRIRVGRVTLRGLPKGKWRKLTKQEIDSF